MLVHQRVFNILEQGFPTQGQPSNSSSSGMVSLQRTQVVLYRSKQASQSPQAAVWCVKNMLSYPIPFLRSVFWTFWKPFSCHIAAQNLYQDCAYLQKQCTIQCTIHGIPDSNYIDSRKNTTGAYFPARLLVKFPMCGLFRETNDLHPPLSS